MNTIVRVHVIYVTWVGRDLPDMSTLALRCTPDHTCYVCYTTLPALYKSAKPA